MPEFFNSFTFDRMALTSLKLIQFKNHDNLEVEPAAKWNAFTGMNGLGKTNALDGIYLLCVLKSFLNHSMEACVKWDTQFFRIEAVMNSEDQIEMTYQREGNRKIIFNGKRIEKISEYIGKYPVMVIQPIDDYKLLEGSAARRKILDQAVGQMNGKYLQALIRYNKLIKQRNALLKKMRSENRLDTSQLSIYEPQLHACTVELFNGRQRLVESMIPDMQTFYRTISNGREIPDARYAYDVDPSQYLDVIKTSYEQDMASGRTTRGPHLDDLQLLLDNYELKASGSQGQRKSLLVALKLAIYRIMANWTGKLPILLLDDLFDKLDNERVKNLLSLINESIFGQVFISDKDDAHLLEIFSELNLDINHIKLEN